MQSVAPALVFRPSSGDGFLTRTTTDRAAIDYIFNSLVIHFHGCDFISDGVEAHSIHHQSHSHTAATFSTFEMIEPTPMHYR
jgi:hypothetical protein